MQITNNGKRWGKDVPALKIISHKLSLYGWGIGTKFEIKKICEKEIVLRKI